MNTSFLLIKKTDFKTKIQQQVEIGERLDAENVYDATQFYNFKEGLESWHDVNLEYLEQSFDNPHNKYRDEYGDAGYTYMGDIATDHPNNEYQTQKDLLKARLLYLKRLINKSDLLRTLSPQEIKEESQNTKHSSHSNKEIFIVHGQDNEAKISTARFIEKLGFRPIILHEQASSGKTIIEKIEEYTNVGFGIVLYTPCDLGGKKEPNPSFQNRARQNVVFEHGFLIGKIGRKNVCALVKNEVEKPNDISGVVYIKMDEDDAWHLKLVKELRNSGYDVDANKL